MHARDASSANPTILLAESDASLRRWLGVLLREAGYHVLEAGAGPDVLRHLRSRAPIHVVITDARLGRMPGWEIAQHTSTLRPGVPIVRLIGNRAEGMPIYRPELDPSVILWKPFTITQLLEVIRSLLGQHSAGASEADPAAEFSTGPYTFYLRSPIT